MITILGAGLAGLSAAAHLDHEDKVVLERESEPGGLCRSIREDGFTFDYTGHLLHLRDPSMRDWVQELLPEGWLHLHRSAWIHSHGSLTPYPFQANTADLPVEVRLECLLGFTNTLRRSAPRLAPVPEAIPMDKALPFLAVAPEPAQDEPTFLDWILATFGEGFARHFFIPYNTKLWRRDLREVTGDWVSWLIPRPSLADVLRGAITAPRRTFGYNPDFLYPEAGGIDALPRSMAARLAPGVVRTGCTVISVDAGRRRVTLAGGETIDAEFVLTSLPLDVLAAMTTDLPEDARRAAASLSFVGVRAVNLGVKGAPFRDGVQWVYFPEPALPFHRVGLPAALTQRMAPEGHHALTAEAAFVPGEVDEPGSALERTLDGLLSAGILRDRADIVYTRVVHIPRAYVTFDRARRRVLPDLFRWYLQRGVVPMGRYGAWDYLAMEDSLRHGREVAAWVRGQRT